MIGPARSRHCEARTGRSQSLDPCAVGPPSDSALCPTALSGNPILALTELTVRKLFETLVFNSHRRKHEHDPSHAWSIDGASFGPSSVNRTLGTSDWACPDVFHGRWKEARGRRDDGGPLRHHRHRSVVPILDGHARGVRCPATARPATERVRGVTVEPGDARR